MPKRFVVFASIFLSLSASADTLGEIRAALRGLHAKQPIRATYETKSGNVAKGRFFDQDVTSGATVEARIDDDGATITYPRPQLERATAQRAARDAGAKRDPKVPSVADVSATRIAEMLDFAKSLDAMLDRASVVEERAGSVDGKPARLVVMNLSLRDRPEIKGGRFDVKGDRLTLWIGADSLPLVAERVAKFSAGILFLKMQGDVAERWTFAHRDDRLVITRYERTDHSAGMGQSANNKEVETITIRSAPAAP